MRLSAVRTFLVGWVLVELLSSGAGRAWSQTTPPAPESNYVKMLKKAPAGRQAAIIEVIGKRGDVADLTYLLGRATAVEPAGFPAATRCLALNALTEAATTRKLQPTAGLSALNPWIASGSDVDPETRLAAIRLAAICRLELAVPGLIEAADGKSGPDHASRDQAIVALAAIGTGPARAALDQFASSKDLPVQQVAIAALVRLDIDAAAQKAAEAIANATPNQDLAPLIAAFLDRQGGGAKLLAAIERRPPSADGAKLTLRAIAALGRADEPLVNALNKIAGVEGDPKPPGPAEMAELIADVANHGDPARGERIFRRAEINCMKCHAIAGAAGGVGPELSALGLSSPVDYIVNSILLPDQAIKEEYQTRVITTNDGRVLQGIVAEEDDRKVVLKDAQGERREVPTSAIEESAKGGSLMPKGLVSTLTRSEFVDLVRFLSELGRPGAYAIRATPTIQRWRALNPVPPVVTTTAALSADDFRTAVLKADLAHWVAVYAWSSGDLPVAEVLEASGGRVGLIQGELVVSAPGFVRLQCGPKARPDTTVWIDEMRVPIEADGSATVALAVGLRRITIRVSEKIPREAIDPIRLAIIRVATNPAELVVVGGR